MWTTRSFYQCILSRNRQLRTTQIRWVWTSGFYFYRFLLTFELVWISISGNLICRITVLSFWSLCFFNWNDKRTYLERLSRGSDVRKSAVLLFILNVKDCSLWFKGVLIRNFLCNENLFRLVMKAWPSQQERLHVFRHVFSKRNLRFFLSGLLRYC